MLDDLSDAMARVRSMQKNIERMNTKSGVNGGGFSGTGAYSILIDPGNGIGEASADYTTVVGTDAKATDSNATAYGFGAEADGLRSTSVGENAIAGGDYSTTVGSQSETSGDYGVAFGEQAKATAMYGTAVGSSAVASGVDSSALGPYTTASHANSTAVGQGAETTAANQVMLGTSAETVVVPGTFSTPSARRLKQNIIPAPDLRDIFPELVEYEYIDAACRRRLGFIADDLLGTDAERFVVFDDVGRPSGIDYLTLLVAQNAQLNARLTALENKD